MVRIKNFTLIRWIALALIIAAVLLTIFQLAVYSRLRSTFSTGTTLGGVDVSNLTPEEAATRLTQAYSVAVEMHYGEDVIQAKPAVLGFSLDLAGMMAAADQARTSSPFWPGFIDYLFNRLPAAQEIPLRSKIDLKVMRSYLTNEIAARYDRPAEAFIPIPGTVNFETGSPGRQLDVEKSIELVSSALKFPSPRVVNLATTQTGSSRPSLTTLKVLLQQIVDAAQFTGEVEIYMIDLQSGSEIQVAYRAGEQLKPEIAFSADSTIKIPIMVESFRRLGEPLTTEYANLLQDMIIRSDNTAPDSLMSKLMSPTLGPLEVTKSMKTLGLKNTFLAGMFYTGAPLLQAISTPANSRTDVITDPDPYNQTTPVDIGLLLNDIYECAQNGGGSFAAAFPGEITQNECKSMISYLTQNHIGVLIEAGVPEGTKVAHKHGWAIDPVDGLMHTVGDAALVYTPGGNYILTIYIHNSNQIIWDAANKMFADLSSAVYNYFNLGVK
jgi:beta-lactamase class A